MFEIIPSQAQYGTSDSNGDANTSGRAPNTADTGGIYLQLGAFSAYDNADNFLARMRAQLPSISPLESWQKMAYSRFMRDLIPIKT